MAKLDLGKMVGPLPLGGWVVVVAGGLGAGLITRRRRAAVPAEDASLPSIAQGNPLGGGIWTTTPSMLPAMLPQPLAPAIETNEAWHREATRRLIGEGYTGYAADQAISKYLAGMEGLSAEELAIVETAMRLLGPAPSPPGLAPAGAPKAFPWDGVSGRPNPNAPPPIGATGHAVRALQAFFVGEGFSGGMIGDPWSEAWNEAALKWAESKGVPRWRVYQGWAKTA